MNPENEILDAKRFDGMTVEQAIATIKRKHFTEIDSTELAFLKARESYLSEDDKRIYLEGEDPRSVRLGGLTQQEAILEENKELEVAQAEVSEVMKEANVPAPVVLNPEQVAADKSDAELEEESKEPVLTPARKRAATLAAKKAEEEAKAAEAAKAEEGAEETEKTPEEGSETVETEGK